MFNKQKQARWNALRAKKRQGILTVAESEELLLLSQELDAFESVYLSPAIKRLRQERSEIDAQNRQLEELLKEQEAYLTRARALVAELEAQSISLNSRFTEITGAPLHERKGGSVVS